MKSLTKKIVVKRFGDPKQIQTNQGTQFKPARGRTWQLRHSKLSEAPDWHANDKIIPLEIVKSST